MTRFGRGSGINRPEAAEVPETYSQLLLEEARRIRASSAYTIHIEAIEFYRVWKSGFGVALFDTFYDHAMENPTTNYCRVPLMIAKTLVGQESWRIRP
jgi:hypothetical protein